jgi:hypothetical protein
VWVACETHVPTFCDGSNKGRPSDPHPSSSRQFPLKMLEGTTKDPGLQGAHRQEEGMLWAEQKALARDDRVVKVSSSRTQAQFRTRLALVTDTAYFGCCLCLLWAFFDNPFVAFFLFLGSVLGIAYTDLVDTSVAGNTVEFRRSSRLWCWRCFQLAFLPSHRFDSKV